MANMSDMFGGIKQKLGFGGQQAEAAYDEYDEYDEYEDYEDEGDYDEYADVSYTQRGSFGNRNTVTTREVGASMPRLVSYSDARESGRTSSLSRNRSTGSSVGRTMMDSSLPHSMTPEGAAEVSAAASRRHASGLDSLFSSTAQKGTDTAGSTSRLGVIGAAASAAPASSAGGRTVRIVKPTEYSQVSEVAAMLRAGDAVVLVFKATPESLEKRLLDFSFGVASALSANVECIGSKVFSITVGAGLSDAEQESLRSQGIL